MDNYLIMLICASNKADRGCMEALSKPMQAVLCVLRRSPYELHDFNAPPAKITSIYGIMLHGFKSLCRRSKKWIPI